MKENICQHNTVVDLMYTGSPRGVFYFLPVTDRETDASSPLLGARPKLVGPLDDADSHADGVLYVQGGARRHE